MVEGAEFYIIYQHQSHDSPNFFILAFAVCCLFPSIAASQHRSTSSTVSQHRSAQLHSTAPQSTAPQHAQPPAPTLGRLGQLSRAPVLLPAFVFFIIGQEAGSTGVAANQTPPASTLPRKELRRPAARRQPAHWPGRGHRRPHHGCQPHHGAGRPQPQPRPGLCPRQRCRPRPPQGRAPSPPPAREAA